MKKRSIGVMVAILMMGPCAAIAADPVPAASLRGKIMCGYQGWFRCPGDAAGLGWIHWSNEPRSITSKSLTFEMWPDMAEYPPEVRYPAPGFTRPDGQPATLFSSEDAATVSTHFQWMRDYGIDGAFLQHFLVDLPGGPGAERYPSRMRVLKNVQDAARQTGRVWALSYDISGMPSEKIYDVLTTEWKHLVDQKITADPRYLRDGGRPVVQIWGFYHGNAQNLMTAALGNRLLDFFQSDGPYAAYVLGGGDWHWRTDPDPEWQTLFRRLDALAPWNVGNYSRDEHGIKKATTNYWARDKTDCDARGKLWVPVVYPGFRWDNLAHTPPGSSEIPRRKGAFLWEQFHELARLKAETVYVAMFDEVDEGTAIFKIANDPPKEAPFLGLEGMPSTWYLRLVGEGGRMLRGERPLSAEIPIRP